MIIAQGSEQKQWREHFKTDVENMVDTKVDVKVEAAIVKIKKEVKENLDEMIEDSKAVKKLSADVDSLRRSTRTMRDSLI